MEQCSSYGWIFCNEDEGMMGDMRQFILQSRMELEATVLAANEEIMKKEEELIHVKDLLMMTIRERDEAQSKFQKLMLEKLILQQQLQKQQQLQPAEKQQLQLQHQQKAVAAAVLSNITNTKTANCFSTTSSESDDSSIISSSPRAAANSPALQPPLPLPSLPPQIAAKLASSRRPLPEKGQLLKAVMEAGPLLQTLLLAGPLPQWQHPPPQLDSIEIPPVTINTNSSPRKRGLDIYDCSIISSPKYQRVV